VTNRRNGDQMRCAENLMIYVHGERCVSTMLCEHEHVPHRRSDGDLQARLRHVDADTVYCNVRVTHQHWLVIRSTNRS
jgi:hypothetical protein